MLQRTTSQWWRRQESARLRLVVEGSERSLDIADFRAFRDAGFDVAQCGGAESEGACPVQRGERCSLIDNADVVLATIGAGAALAEAVRSVHPAVPLVVEVPRDDKAAADLLPPDCTAMPFPASIDGQLRVLRRAATTTGTPSSAAFAEVDAPA